MVCPIFGWFMSGLAGVWLVFEWFDWFVGVSSFTANVTNQYIKSEISKNNNIYTQLTKLYQTFSGDRQRRSTHSTNEYCEWTNEYFKWITQ